MLAQLQRTAGNQAIRPALTAARHGSGAAKIMRFPSGVLDKPLKKKEWKSYTKTVAKSGEGVSGGVFFSRSKRGGVKNVVVKPEPSADTKNEKKVKETATERANELLASAVFSVPKGRTVYCDSAEGRHHGHSAKGRWIRPLTERYGWIRANGLLPSYEHCLRIVPLQYSKEGSHRR